MPGSRFLFAFAGVSVVTMALLTIPSVKRELSEALAVLLRGEDDQRRRRQIRSLRRRFAVLNNVRSSRSRSHKAKRNLVLVLNPSRNTFHRNSPGNRMSSRWPWLKPNAYWRTWQGPSSAPRLPPLPLRPSRGRLFRTRGLCFLQHRSNVRVSFARALLESEVCILLWLQCWSEADAQAHCKGSCRESGVQRRAGKHACQLITCALPRQPQWLPSADCVR